MSRTEPGVVAVIADALRRERGRADLSLGELARRAGIAKSTLSQLEAGTGNPGVETLWALAVALDVPFSRLVEAPAAPVRVIRAGGGVTLRAEHADYTSTLLAACPPGARRDLHVVTVGPERVREAEAHAPGTGEHVVVTSGRLRTGPTGDEVELATGDYAWFPADRPHRYVALGGPASAVLVMEYR